MSRKITKLLVCCLALLIASGAFGKTIEIRLKDGSRWRGTETDHVEVRFLQQGVEVPIEGQLTKVTDLYIVVNGTIGGIAGERLIFRADIVAMKTVKPSSGDSANARPSSGASPTERSSSTATGRSSATASSSKSNEQPMGVFVLPLSGMVGEGFRHNEIEAVAREADKYGPGQIIVLIIESGGGLGIEMEQIHFTLAEVRKRHRVVAWIKEAISAAAATASNCHEIYFTTSGSLGAMTGFAGGVSLKGEELQQWMDAAGRWMESGGRSRYIAHAMIEDQAMLSYDKDPVTGQVTWYNDLSGEFILSRPGENLVFTASTAVHSGFADGIADTEEELAKLLNLPKWHEISDYGRRIAADWQRTVEKAKAEIPLLAARLNYKGAAGGQISFINSQINIFNELIRWWDRCPNVCFLMGVPPKETLERQLAELRRTRSRMGR